MTEALNRIREAHNGQHGHDQKRIAEQGFKLIALLLRKNADYGGSAWQAPLLAPGMTPREAIQCRMSDKIQRLQKLLDGTTAQINETIDDTIQDLSGYGILWLGAPTEQKTETEV